MSRSPPPAFSVPKRFLGLESSFSFSSSPSGLRSYSNFWFLLSANPKLLQEDAWFTMPPIPGWYKGRANIAAIFKAVVFARISTGKWRLLATRANGRPAFAIYRRQEGDHTYQLYSLLVLDVVGGQIASIVAFLDLPGLAPFALPPTLDV